MCTKKPKIILFDIETSLAVMGAFSLWNDGIPHTNILEDWYIHCVCWKELGKKRVHSAHTYTSDDKAVCEKIHEVLKDTDILIAHNGAKFDIKKLNSRFMIHGLDPIPPITMIDTLREIKKVASFTSHRLDYLGKVLCNDQKMSTTSGLWLKALAGDKKAINEMVKYCKQDVNLLEELYLKIRKYIKNHPNLSSGKELACPTCGSTNYHKYGKIRMKSGIVYQKYKCTDCGSIFKDKVAMEKPISRSI